MASTDEGAVTESGASILVVGLGPGDPDALTIGTLTQLQSAQRDGWRLCARTQRHPTIAWLAKEHGIRFTHFFDTVYETRDSFAQVYADIATQVLAISRDCRLVYAVPGHPLIGEESVASLLEQARREDICVNVANAVSFADAVLTATQTNVDDIQVVDSLGLPDPSYKFRFLPLPFNPRVHQIVYQVYDQSAASRAKIALLEVYGPGHPVTIVGSAGVQGEQKLTTLPLCQVDRHPDLLGHLTTLQVPPLDEANIRPDFCKLLDIMARLRVPQSGCPWDLEQDGFTLRRFLVEEAYEVIDAIESGAPDKLADELGDLLLQIVFHAQLACEDDQFTINDVLSAIVRKLIRRHPHVFGELKVTSAEEVLENWQEIKKAEAGHRDRKSILDGVPRSLPALMRAMEVSKRAARAGFEWDHIAGVFDKLSEEVVELKDAIDGSDNHNVDEEIGDLLFTVVNLARFQRVDPEDALQQMVSRFIRRFQFIERAAAQVNTRLEDMETTEMNRLWEKAKTEQLESI